MLLIFLSMLIIMSMLFIFLNHPLSMGLILMIQTIITAMSTGLMIKKFWYSYILFMVMIGGMLVLFLYMTSVASNKKFKFSWKLSIFIFFISIFIMLTMNNDFIMNSILTKNINIEMSMSKFFYIQTSSIMIMLILYLLISLIAVVKITKTNFGPLRQK